MIAAAKKFKHTLLKTLLVSQLIIIPAAMADAQSDGEKGIEEYRQGNLIEGMHLLHSSAKQGYAPAQVTLAFILDQAEQDREAVHWYQQAADQNNVRGIFGLGTMYAKGEGVEKDPPKAGQLIEKAARMDYLPAMLEFANALEFGQLGFESSQSEAVSWYLKAAEAGDDVSMRRLRDAYLNGELGLPVDPVKSAEWDRKINMPKEKDNDD